MISSLDPAAQSFLTGLDQIQQTLDTAQTELTTGLQINVVSDDPSEISDIWQLNSELDQTNQTDTNRNDDAKERKERRSDPRIRKCMHRLHDT